MAYSVSILPEALRALKKLPKDVQRRIQKRIDGLTANPRPSGIKALLPGAEGLNISVSKSARGT